MLAVTERKARLSYGAQSEIQRLRKCSKSWVSLVLKGAYRDRAVEEMLAARMTPSTTVEEAFGAPGPESTKKSRRRRRPRRIARVVPAVVAATVEG